MHSPTVVVRRAGPRVAILIPCYNEVATIGKVIEQFRLSIPEATIHVFDNNSTDDTSVVARDAHAEVHRVMLQGKGNVTRRMFADVDADIYLMVDGDGTYDASTAPTLVNKLLEESLDMVVGARCADEQAAYRTGHRFGNTLLTRCVALLFGRRFHDMLSGYRAFSRRYVKSFPAHSMGFDIETELAVHALQLRMPVAEVPTVYGARPEGSVSKLNTYRDGFRILFRIARLCKSERPFMFFSAFALGCAVLSVILATPLIETYLQTGLVPRLPTAVLCASLMVLSGLFVACGLILDVVTRGRIEAKHMAYLALPGPGVTPGYSGASADAAQKREGGIDSAS